ncbi:MAG: protein TonB [Cyclobacteriaceae bacterium]|jgi:protein TonB
MKTLLLTALMTLTFATASANDPEKNVVVAPEIDNLELILEKLVYPIEARENAIEGNVTVQFIVDKNGKLIKHTITKSCNPMLEKAMNEVIEDFKFSPASKNGLPVAGKITVPFAFSLVVD